MPSRIVGTGRYLPAQVLTNDELAQRVDTSDEWIRTRTGIRQRHIAADGEQTSDLALAARARRARGGATSRPPTSISSSSPRRRPDMIFPSTACILQEKLGATRRRRRSTCRPCARGFVYALALADKHGRERHGAATRWSSAPKSIRAFSTGTIAARACCSATAPARSCSCPRSAPGILSAHLHADGRYRDILCVPGRCATARSTARRSCTMDGQRGVQVRGEGAGRRRARSARRQRHDDGRHRLADPAPGQRPHHGRHREKAGLPLRARGDDRRPPCATRRRRRFRSRSTSRCATAASAPAITSCCSASAADSPGARRSCDGENGRSMKLAFVFPGQGSQSVGMLADYADASRPCAATFAEASARARRGSLDAGRRRSGRRAQPDRQHAAGDARRPASPSGARGARPAGRRRDRRRPQPRRIHGAGRGRRARASPTPCRWCAFARRRCRTRCPPARARWRRSSACDDAGVAAACARGGAGRGRRAGQFQRAGPGRHRRPQGARSSARSWQRRRAAPSARCCCRCRAPFHSSLMKPAAERLAARLADVTLATPRFRWSTTSTSHEQPTPDAIRAALAQQAASPVRWVETDRRRSSRAA